MKHYKGSIKKWLTTIIVVVTILNTLLGLSLFVLWYKDDQTAQTKALVNTVSDVIGQNVAKIILLNDVSAAADITTSLYSFKNLKYMVLYKLDATPVYQFSKEDKNFRVKRLVKNVKPIFYMDKNHVEVLTKAQYQENHLGYVYLDIEIRSLYDVFLENIDKIIMAFFLIGFFSVLLANYFAKKFTAPILKLVKFLEKIEFKEKLSEKIDVKGNNEYTHLYDEVNTMLDRINSSHEALKIAAVAFETQNGMAITDKKHKIIEVNRAFLEITGYAKEEVIGNTPALLKSGKQDEEFYKNMHKSLHEHHYWNGEIYNKRKDGTIYPEYLTIQSVLDENGDVEYFIASFIDISLQKTTEAKLNYLQRYDTLTSLPNQALLLQQLEEYLQTSSSKQWGVIFMLNICEFKLINEAFGYDTGDVLLQKVAERLQSLDGVTLVSRIGADKFCLWFDTFDKLKDKTFEESKLITEYIRTILTQPYKIDKKQLNIIIEIGINIYSSSDRNASKIIQDAEMALHSAKGSQHRISYYDKNYQNAAQKQVNIYTELLEAIQKNQFELYYQPQYDTEEKIYAFEALIRWNKTGKVIAPNDFIPIAERTGLIVEIGRIVIQKAAAQLAFFSKMKHYAHYEIAVNVSAKQFMDEDFLALVKEEVQKYKIDPKHLKVELTETVVVKDIEKVIEKMHQLKKIGIQISLDDFGTGYSSLQYLKNLPLNQVKIDQSFVRNMLSDKSDVAIIKSILLMCETLQIDVIAEGVETKEHVAFLKELGCEYFQGYYFSKPKKISELDL